MSDVSSLGALTAFAAGIVSFLSPCVLPLVPSYVSYIAGHTLVNTDHHMKHDAHRLSALGLSLRLFPGGYCGLFQRPDELDGRGAR
jgi:cytochrome c-type biogenesis protein